MNSRLIAALQDKLARGTLDEIASAYNQIWALQTSKANREGIATKTLTLAMEFSRIDVLQYLLDLRDVIPSLAFSIAAERGNLESLMYLMEKRQYQSLRPTGAELFQRAIVNDNLSVIKYLVRSQNINVDQGYEYTPLQHCAARGQMETTRFLLDSGATIDLRDLSGSTALHLACQSGNYETVKLLCERGANVNAKTSEDMTPLHLAASQTDLDILLCLLRHGAHPDGQVSPYRSTPLHLVCMVEKHAFAKSLIQYGANKAALDRSGDCPSAIALRRGSLDLFRLCFPRGESSMFVNRLNQTFLHLAAEIGNAEIIPWLLEQDGIDPNAKDSNGQTIAHYLAKGVLLDQDTREVFQLIVEYGGRLEESDSDGRMPIHDAAIYDRRIIPTLVALGADLNGRDGIGRTALHYVGVSDLTSTTTNESDKVRNSEFFHWLLERGCDINDTDNCSRTILHVALARDINFDVLQDMLGRGLNVMARDDSGKTSLHAICTKKKIKQDQGPRFLQVFLAARGNVQAQTLKGWTALHYAVLFNRSEMVKLLLDLGVDISSTTREGWTALHMLGLNQFVATMSESPEKYVQRMMNGQVMKAQPPEQEDSEKGEEPMPIDPSNSFGTCNSDALAEYLASPKLQAQTPAGELNLLHLLMTQVPDLSVMDDHGNFPFFLAAMTEWTDGTYVMLQSAALRGLFGLFR